MKFSDKIKTESNNGVLSFLSEYGFRPNETCGYGCCKGWHKGYWSGDRGFFNRVTVWIDGDKIRASNHNEYSCGGGEYKTTDYVDYDNATQREIIEMIDNVLPNDLD